MISFSACPQFSQRGEAELVVVPLWETAKKPKLAVAEVGPLAAALKVPLEEGDFTGKREERLLLYVKGAPEKRCLLLGLGKEEELSTEYLRRAYAGVAKECQKREISDINLLIPTLTELRKVEAKGCVQGVVEGLLLANYAWKKQTSAGKEVVLLRKVQLVGLLPTLLDQVRLYAEMAEGVYFARDLINESADIVTPHYLGETAIKIAKKFPAITAHVHDRKWIEKEKMGLFAAVARASYNEPAFIVLEYKGYPRSKEHTVLVGKGLTYDTGGLNLKPTGSMETMRCDMSGAATVLATVATAAALKLKHNVTAVVGATENAIGAKSYKPGDVYPSFSGKSVEIGNTDAEGRLVLADVLSYSVKKWKPTRIIDIATLTGSIMAALGEEIAGLFCNEEKLANQLLESSSATSELLWRMPLHEAYKEQLKSDVSDLRNIGERFGGSITAALFLREFVEAIPWAHLDVAGTAFARKENGYHPKNGVGFGVRLLIDFLYKLSNS